MTAGELIDYLKRFSPSAEVKIEAADLQCWRCSAFNEDALSIRSVNFNSSQPEILASERQ